MHSEKDENLRKKSELIGSESRGQTILEAAVISREAKETSQCDITWCVTSFMKFEEFYSCKRCLAQIALNFAACWYFQFKLILIKRPRINNYSLYVSYLKY